jgi:hypothetical protein
MKIGNLGDVTGSAYLETGVRMHYYGAGQGSAALVLLHGFPQTSWQWRRGPVAADAGDRLYCCRSCVSDDAHSRRPGE